MLEKNHIFNFCLFYISFYIIFISVIYACIHVRKKIFIIIFYIVYFNLFLYNFHFGHLCMSEKYIFLLYSMLFIFIYFIEFSFQ